MAFDCVQHDGRMNVFGFDVPFYLGPFLLLGLISLLVPNASFIGHLSGIIWGLICGSGLFFSVEYGRTTVHRNLVDIWFWISFIAFCILMLHSIVKSNPFGINERIAATVTPKPRTRVVDGVIVRENSS